MQGSTWKQRQIVVLKQDQTILEHVHDYETSLEKHLPALTQGAVVMVLKSKKRKKPQKLKADAVVCDTEELPSSLKVKSSDGRALHVITKRIYVKNT